MKKTVKAALALILFASAVFAQGTITDARKAIDAEQYQKAKDILKKLIAAKPVDGENYFFLGNVYLKNDNIDSAKTTYNSGVAADKEFALNYVGLGSVDLANNNAAAAKANFDKAADLAKKKDDAPFLYIGKAYTWAEVNGVPKPDYTQALVYLDKAMAINPKDAEVLVAKGDAYLGRNKDADISTAYSNYDQAITLDNNLLRAKLELAVINKRTRAWKEAIDEFNKIIAINPNYGPVYRELAETHYNWGNVEVKDYDMHMKTAADFYEKYLDLTDRSLDSRMRHADFLVLTKNWKALEKEALAMANVTGTNPRIFRYLSIAYFNNGNYSESEKAASQFLSKVENQPGRIIAKDYEVRGRARTRLGRIPEGLDDLSKAFVLDTSAAPERKLNVIDSVSAEAAKLYAAKDYENAIKAYTLAIKNPNLSKRATDSYYLGVSNYQYFLAKYAKDSVNRAQGIPYLVAADSLFSNTLKVAPKGSATEEQLLNLKAGVAVQMDDPKKNAGTFIPAVENYIAVIGSKPNITPAEKTKVINYLSKIGYYYYVKVDENGAAADQLPIIAKAKEYYTKILALDPANEYALKLVPELDRLANVITNPPAKKAAAPGATKPKQ